MYFQLDPNLLLEFIEAGESSEMLEKEVDGTGDLWT